MHLCTQPELVSAASHSAVLTEIVHQSPLSEGFVSAFLLILLSELGDKTFFIAVLLALKHNKSIVFAGSFGALAVMTVISVSHFLYGVRLAQAEIIQFMDMTTCLWHRSAPFSTGAI